MSCPSVSSQSTTAPSGGTDISDVPAVVFDNLSISQLPVSYDIICIERIVLSMTYTCTEAITAFTKVQLRVSHVPSVLHRRKPSLSIHRCFQPGKTQGGTESKG